MIIYTQTPDYYDEYLQHGWLKDQAAKVHKYIERWRGKNGKWYYHYAVNKAKQFGGKAKLKAIDLKTKFNRKIKGMSADQISYKNGKRTSERHDDGKAKSTTRPYGNRVYKGETETYNNGYNQKGYAYMRPETQPGVEAGRERRFNKKRDYTRNLYRQILNDQESNRNRTAKIKDSGAKFGKSAALSKRGYSDSKKDNKGISAIEKIRLSSIASGLNKELGPENRNQREHERSIDGYNWNRIKNKKELMSVYNEDNAAIKRFVLNDPNSYYNQRLRKRAQIDHKKVRR